MKKLALLALIFLTALKPVYADVTISTNNGSTAYFKNLNINKKDNFNLKLDNQTSISNDKRFVASIDNFDKANLTVNVKNFIKQGCYSKYQLRTINQNYTLIPEPVKIYNISGASNISNIDEFKKFIDKNSNAELIYIYDWCISK